MEITMFMNELANLCCEVYSVKQDTRGSNQSYTGWWETRWYRLSDGRIFERSFGCGVCGNDQNDGAMEVTEAEVPEGGTWQKCVAPVAVVNAADLKVIVPKGLVAVFHRYNDADYICLQSAEWLVWEEGEEAPWYARILHEGEVSAEKEVFSNGRPRIHSAGKVVRNVNGRAVVDYGPEEKKRRQDFFRKTAEEAGARLGSLELGYALCKACGPGAALEAVRVYTALKDKLDRQAFDLLAFQAPFGKARQAEVLTHLGVENPPATVGEQARVFAGVRWLSEKLGAAEVPVVSANRDARKWLWLPAAPPPPPPPPPTDHSPLTYRLKF